MSLSDDHFTRLREDEQQQRLEHQAEAATAGAEGAVEDDQPHEDGERQPGHLGNDTATMPLLQTDLEQIAKEGMDERERNPEVIEALRTLEEMDVPNPGLEANGALPEQNER